MALQKEEQGTSPLQRNQPDNQRRCKANKQILLGWIILLLSLMYLFLVDINDF